MKKKVLIFTCADANNFKYTQLMINSLTKFHPVSKDVDILVITDVEAKEAIRQLPKGIILEDLKPYLRDDPYFWYRQKPIIAEPYMDDYELVIGMDSDSIVTGSLDYIFDTKDYDIGTVMNWNRSDPLIYGLVQFQGILPPEYFNCGLVAMRNKKFVHDWKVLCFSEQWNRCQYKEQDMLNAMCYYGNWNVRCFDHGDGLAKYYAWHGLLAKGELIRAKMNGDELYIPQGEGDQPFPAVDTLVKVIHTGGGPTPNKLNYRPWFEDEDIIKRLDYLVSPTK